MRSCAVMSLKSRWERDQKKRKEENRQQRRGIREIRRWEMKLVNKRDEKKV